MSAIGIFDSGIGGLTVLKALKTAMPAESFIYLGDTARLPYGTKSPETLRLYLEQNIKFLMHQGVKAIVVACNSASSVLKEHHFQQIPVYGVIKPGAQAAVKASKSGRIGVLGTKATVTSNAYPKALHAITAGLKVKQIPCPLLVPLVEEGWWQDPITRLILQRYLKTATRFQVDTLILGCTHYPVLKALIAEQMGPDVHLIDSAEMLALQLRQDLATGKIQASSSARRLDIWATDLGEDFRKVGARILEPHGSEVWRLARL